MIIKGSAKLDMFITVRFQRMKEVNFLRCVSVHQGGGGQGVPHSPVTGSVASPVLREEYILDRTSPQPPRDDRRVYPRKDRGYPQRCFIGDGTPLAITQEDFLVWNWIFSRFRIYNLSNGSLLQKLDLAGGDLEVVRDLCVTPGPLPQCAVLTNRDVYRLQVRVKVLTTRDGSKGPSKA